MRYDELTPRQLQVHAEADARGDPGYPDPYTGYFVLTATYLRRQGHCCGRGCRHCPWDAAEQERAGRPVRRG